MERYRPVKKPPPTIHECERRAVILVLGEHTRIIGVEAEAILAEAREELRLDLASPFVRGGYGHVPDETYLPVHSVVDALVHRRQDIPVRLAYMHDLGDFPRIVVAQSPPAELALLVQLVDSLQCLLHRW